MSRTPYDAGYVPRRDGPSSLKLALARLREDVESLKREVAELRAAVDISSDQ